MGFGAFCDGHWCASLWDPSWVQNDLAKNLVLLELFPVVVSIVIWGHLKGVHNEIADSLYRCQMDRFRTLVPSADIEDVKCPDHLWTLIWD